MEQINYEQLIPREPPEDVVSFAYRQGAFEQAYLIYKADRVYEPLEDRWEQAASVVCSECEREFHARKLDAGGCSHGYSSAPFGWWNDATNEAVISGGKTCCPCCGKAAETVHVGSISRHYNELIDDAWVAILSRLPVEGRRDRLVLTDWCVRRCVNKQGRTRHEVWPYTAWVVDETKVVRLMGYRKYMCNISLLGQWEQRKTFVDDFGSGGLLMPWHKGLLEGTTAENSKLDLYWEAGGQRLAGYLALWRKRPAVENLLVQGFGPLVAELIREEAGSYGYRGGIPKLPAVNWREKRPAAMLGLNREELRLVREMGWNASDLKVYRVVRDGGVPGRLPEDMEPLRARGAHACEEILKEAPKEDCWRILRYLEKKSWAWYLLRDYWAMAGKLGWDLTDSLVRWPRNLKAAHDRAMKEQRHRADELLAERFKQRAEELERFSFAVDGLLIRPCRDQAELIAEGKALHHCVGSYAKDHASGRTAILFIRRAEEPDTPYFTLELDEKRLAVRQNRGLRNCDRTPEVREFEETWLAWVRAGALKKKRRSA